MITWYCLQFFSYFPFKNLNGFITFGNYIRNSQRDLGGKSHISFPKPNKMNHVLFKIKIIYDVIFGLYEVIINSYHFITHEIYSFIGDVFSFK